MKSLASRVAILLGATALSGLGVLPPVAVHAQQVSINQNGGEDENGGTINHQNDTDITYGGIGYLGTANGGTGDDGGTGDGNKGGDGGSVTLANTATIVTSNGSPLLGGATGIYASADGGTGGEGGLFTVVLVTFGADGGKGGTGGTVSVTTTGNSDITTDGMFSAGIQATANGGNGGAGGGWFGALGSDSGNGGSGGNAGSAYVNNGGTIVTNGQYSAGILVRAAGGAGGDGGSGPGLISGGGNGGGATLGGTAEGVNSGSITTNAAFSAGMVVQSVGGGGGDGSDGAGLIAIGGTGGPGNDGRTATGTNTGHIVTGGTASVGMLVESIGGGGGNGAGAAGLISVGGGGNGGGIGGTATANLGGIIETTGNGSHGVFVQSIGGGGGNGGYAVGVAPNIAVAIGGSGGTGGNGGVVNVNLEEHSSDITVNTGGRSAAGIIAQSVGGGGGNGGGAIALGGIVGVSVGGSGNAAGDGERVNYNVANANVTTHGVDSTGVLIQSIGGGGGNGGFAISAAAAAAVGVGGNGAGGGKGGVVDATIGGSVSTGNDRSIGMIVQSVGGGGGNGGFTADVSLGVSVGVGGRGGGGGDADTVTLHMAAGATQSITTDGMDSAGLVVQSVGGGGGNGGFVGGLAAGANVGIGGNGGGAGKGVAVEATYNGSVETFRERSIGIIVQSIGGGGGNGGGQIGLSAGASVGIGGAGAGGGGAGTAKFFSTTGLNVTTHREDSAGVVVQSVGGGGGNGGFAFNGSVAASVGIGGKAGTASDAEAVTVDISSGLIHTVGDRSTGLIAQSIGGGGGTGGGTASAGLGLNVTIGGKGGGGGTGATVDVTNGAAIHTEGVQSHGVLAQSVGGGGGSGGFAVSIGGPSFSLGGSGASGGGSNRVYVENTGRIDTDKDMSIGIFAQSLGGSGGDGGFAIAAGAFAAVGIGGSGGGGGKGGEVEVENTANITTKGALSHGILAQSVGGGGGNGGSVGTLAVGVWGAASVAIGGGGGDGNLSDQVTVTHKGDIHVGGAGSKAILAQSVGGSGGNGGAAYSGSFSGGPYASASVGVSVGGEGGDGGNGGKVTVRADGNLIADTDAAGSGGIVAQSIGGGGGNGGRAATITGSGSNGVNVSLGVTVGGWAGDGGKGGLVIVDAGQNPDIPGVAGSIVTKGDNAVGIMAQSVGGSGGNGGDSWAAAGGVALNASVNATVSIGGGGGDGNTSGDVLVRNAMTITTGGDMSSAIVAQSIAGGGGNGGATNGATADANTESGVNVAVNVGVGGAGGTGNISGAVDVTNTADLTTDGDYSSGIVAQSIGGGGGMGGATNTHAFHVGGTPGTSVTANVSIGGTGGDGNHAALYRLDGDGNIIGAGVHVDNAGTIRTHGFNAIGILAMSVGGGGGAGGATSADEEIVGDGDAGDTSVGISAAVSLGAGDGSNGGTVSVTNRSLIVTNGADSYGISANSIGGGGGIGGSASSGVIGQYAIGGSLGGAGGGAGDGKQVDVLNTATAGIHTMQERSIGIFAQSVGGGGGAGGAGESKGKSDGAEVSVNLSLGGKGEVGGDGGVVNVDNAGWIQTDKANSHGILAQSIGGSGGIGGASGTSSNDASIAVTLSLGGAGGDGGVSEKVTVNNAATGTILTMGDNSHGIFAQSIGGGGGAGGAGSTENGEAETAVTLYIGGQGGLGSIGGEVEVHNFGSIETLGYISHGIFAQSVGGGGGASGAASGASKADMTIGGGASGLPIPISDDEDDKANGGNVTVTNDGKIITHKDGSYGIFAQSVGGGGGYGGTVTSSAAGSDSVALGLGGKGGNGGNGGDVLVTVSGSIETWGARAHGVVAQSIGGGGGVGGDAKGETSSQLAIGGLGGKGGDGGDVKVVRTGDIITHGVDSMAIFAQSVGGGGGLGGAGFGRFADSADGSSVSFDMFSGTKGEGGVVTIEQDGAIHTTGDRGHGIVAQAVGGGGGAGGSLTDGAAGSGGGEGNAEAASATTKSNVWTEGAQAYAMFGQSSTGIGDASTVHLGAGGSLFAQGLDSVAAYAQSTSNVGFARGNLTVDLNGQYTIGGGGTGVAIALVGGATNVVTNNSLTYAMGSTFTYVPAFETFSLLAAGDEPFVPENAILASLFDDFSALTATGTSGNDLIENQKTFNGDGSVKTLGRFIGNIDLGGGDNGFHNFADSSMVNISILDPDTLAYVTPASIKLNGGNFLNDGLMTNNGIGALGALKIEGGYTQSTSGDLVTDLDLHNHMTDIADLTGAGDYAGDAPLNFTSIDRLFDRDGYAIATGDHITTTMTPTLLHTAVGFDFKTKASDDEKSLILYSDSPSFEDMINDPASGVTDPGVVQMAQYMDGLENVQALYDSPSELARMINMLRFSQTEEEFGKALTRLTPHYAVHTYEMINRSTDTMLQTARECTGLPNTYDYDGRCVWMTITPQQDYNRDAGPGVASRDDVYETLSMGAMGEVSDNWSLGGTIGRTDFTSDISFKGDLLSHTTGESWQAYALAKYTNAQYFADFALGGGTGKFEGLRDTTIALVGYIPGETLGGQYLDEIMHEGIGNSVTYTQNTSQFAASARFGFTRQLGGIYVQPTLQLDARHLRVSGKEDGSVAAFNFGGTSNTYLSATPGLEIGTDIALSDKASLRVYANGGIEFSDMDWKIEGQFKAAEGLGAPPLTLTEEVDSPLYRVGAGIELNGVNGVGLAIRYNGAFGEKVEMNAVSAALKVRF